MSVALTNNGLPWCMSHVLRITEYGCLMWQLEEGMTASIPEITAASDLASIPAIDDP